MLAPLSVNWTEPVGVPADDESAEIVAVKVTPCPKTVGGDGAAPIDVVVVVPLTVCTMGSLRLVPNGVPAAAAVIRCVPPDKLDVVIDAELVPLGTQSQTVPKFGVRRATAFIGTAPSKKMTLPNARGATTVTVKVTLWSKFEGLALELTVVGTPKLTAAAGRGEDVTNAAHTMTTATDPAKRRLNLMSVSDRFGSSAHR
jgi:hypothetical protein